MMNDVEASGLLVELIRENDDIANHADGCGAEALVAAENALGCDFPSFVLSSSKRNSGTWDMRAKSFSAYVRTL